MQRHAALRGFLARHGWADDALTEVAQDASFRRYWRLPGAIVMDADPEVEDVRPFLRVQAHMHAIGLSVPDVYASDVEQGFLLLEDFGDDTFAKCLASATTRRDGWSGDQLYETAVEALAILHAEPFPADLPAWDRRSMVQAAEATFLDWWWPYRFGVAAPQRVRDDFAGALHAMLEPLDTLVTVVHRDFFAGNLFWLPSRSGMRRVGIIDFQDASLGHPAYDLASLVEDARRDLPPQLVEHAISRYLAMRPDLDPATFRWSYAAAAAHRHLRVAGLWVRLARRDGKTAYLQHGSRTWRLLLHSLSRPAAAPLAAFFHRWIEPVP